MTATPAGPPKLVLANVAPLLAQGKPCSTKADCGAEEICAPTGGCDVPLRCQPKRLCTQDLVPYCGCDGQSWKGSSTCPDKPYAKKGACGGP